MNNESVEKNVNFLELIVQWLQRSVKWMRGREEPQDERGKGAQSCLSCSHLH